MAATDAKAHRVAMSTIRRFDAMVLYSTSSPDVVRIDLVVTEPGDCALARGVPVSFAFDRPDDTLVEEVFQRVLRRWCSRDVVVTVELSRQLDGHYHARFAHEGAALGYTFCDETDPVPERA